MSVVLQYTCPESRQKLVQGQLVCWYPLSVETDQHWLPLLLLQSTNQSRDTNKLLHVDDE